MHVAIHSQHLTQAFTRLVETGALSSTHLSGHLCTKVLTAFMSVMKFSGRSTALNQFFKHSHLDKKLEAHLLLASKAALTPSLDIKLTKSKTSALVKSVVP